MSSHASEATSRVVVFDEFGGPDVLHIIDATVPEPAAGEVRIRIEAFAVNPLDAMMRSGTSPAPVPLPARLGIEATGVIDTLGSGVTTFRVGDPVIVAALPDSSARGSYAEHIVVPASRVIARPSELDVEQSAAVWVAYATAYGALFETAHLRPADHLLIAGASGAVGRAAMQLARFVGAHPVALTRDPVKVDDLLAAGADHVIVSGRDDVVDVTRRLTGGRGADVVLDLVGGPGQFDLLRAARPAAGFVVAGFLDARPAPASSTEDVPILRYRGWDHLLDAEELERTAAFFTDVVRRGAVRPAIDTVFALDDVVDAHRRFDQGLHGGRKIVVRV